MPPEISIDLPKYVKEKISSRKPIIVLAKPMEEEVMKEQPIMEELQQG
jgi:hypothetical protein